MLLVKSYVRSISVEDQLVNLVVVAQDLFQRCLKGETSAVERACLNVFYVFGTVWPVSRVGCQRMSSGRIGHASLWSDTSTFTSAGQQTKRRGRRPWSV